MCPATLWNVQIAEEDSLSKKKRQDAQETSKISNVDMESAEDEEEVINDYYAFTIGIAVAAIPRDELGLVS
jgi:hypothetical protein